MIVPLFNGIDFLPTFFASLRAALPDGAQLILVDDASAQPVWETVPDFGGAESVIRLQNDHNVGYSAAVNRAFAQTTGDVVVQLNTDLVLQPDCITAMVDLIERESEVGIVGSKLIYPTTGLVQHVGMAFGNHTKPHIFAELPASHPLCRRTRELQITTGATVAMTRAVLNRVGPLDERYFNHNEDIEHCLLARRHGLRNFICAESVAHHWESKSGRPGSREWCRRRRCSGRAGERASRSTSGNTSTRRSTTCSRRTRRSRPRRSRCSTSRAAPISRSCSSGSSVAGRTAALLASIGR